MNEAPQRSPNILPALRVCDTSAPCYMALPMQGSQEDRSLGTRRQVGACPTRAGLRQELGSTLMSLSAALMEPDLPSWGKALQRERLM